MSCHKKPNIGTLAPYSLGLCSRLYRCPFAKTNTLSMTGDTNCLHKYRRYEDQFLSLWTILEIKITFTISFICIDISLHLPKIRIKSCLQMACVQGCRHRVSLLQLFFGTYKAAAIVFHVVFIIVRLLKLTRLTLLTFVYCAFDWFNERDI